MFFRVRLTYSVDDLKRGGTEQVVFHTNWVLEGVFKEAPLNVWNMELFREQDGQPLSYFLLNVEIDDDPQLWRLLDERLHGPLEYFDRLILVDNGPSSPHHALHQHVYTFRKPWLFSLERKYTTRTWKKPVLGIAFEKTALNKAAVDHIQRLGVY